MIEFDRYDQHGHDADAHGQHSHDLRDHDYDRGHSQHDRALLHLKNGGQYRVWR